MSVATRIEKNNNEKSADEMAHYEKSPAKVQRIFRLWC
jgi:hypothetical protein